MPDEYTIVMKDEYSRGFIDSLAYHLDQTPCPECDGSGQATIFSISYPFPKIGREVCLPCDGRGWQYLFNTQ